MRTVRIVAPHFVAGVEVYSTRGNKCAPIIHYMRTWAMRTILDYCDKKGWEYTILEEETK